jgi:hypothetical protein
VSKKAVRRVVTEAGADPMPDTFRREAAFSMDLGGEEANSVQELLHLNGTLYAFLSKKIYRIRTADDIDPQRTAPDTRQSYQEAYPIGCSNSFVARSIIQPKRLLDGLVLRSGLDQSKLLDAIWESVELLLLCENAHFRICNESIAVVEECDKIVEECKSNPTIPSLPQVNDLQEKVSSFLGNAKRFLEKTHRVLCFFYNCPDLGSNFGAFRDWMVANRGASVAVIELLDGDHEWIRFIAHARNALPINHSTEKFLLEVQNFRLEPGNKFSPSSWRYDLSARGGPVQDYWSDVVSDMDIHLHNMLTFFEELCALCILDNCDQSLPFQFTLYRIPNEQIREDCPVLYEVRSLRRNF